MGLAEIILVVLLCILTIALIIVCYIKFLGKKSDRTSFFGKFFHFDHFYIEQILRAIYLIFAISGAMFCIGIFLSAVIGSFALNSVGAFFGTFFGGLLLAVIGFAVYEFILRVCYEQALISIRQAVDVRALRYKIVGDVPSPSENNGNLGEFAKAFGKNQQQSQVVTGQRTTPYPGGAPAQNIGAWVCPNCGNRSTGDFCGQCGTRRSGF